MLKLATKEEKSKDDFAPAGPCYYYSIKEYPINDIKAGILGGDLGENNAMNWLIYFGYPWILLVLHVANIRSRLRKFIIFALGLGATAGAYMICVNTFFWSDIEIGGEVSLYGYMAILLNFWLSFIARIRFT
jgi:hypothetical protein